MSSLLSLQRETILDPMLHCETHAVQRSRLVFELNATNINVKIPQSNDWWYRRPPTELVQRISNRGSPNRRNVASSYISIWFGYIARLSQWGGRPFTCTNCFYLPSKWHRWGEGIHHAVKNTRPKNDDRSASASSTA